MFNCVLDTLLGSIDTPRYGVTLTNRKGGNQPVKRGPPDRSMIWRLVVSKPNILPAGEPEKRGAPNSDPLPLPTLLSAVLKAPRSCCKLSPEVEYQEKQKQENNRKAPRDVKTSQKDIIASHKRFTSALIPKDRGR